MSTKEIIETGKFWVVNVDPELIPTSKFDYINKERGVKRIWGIDPQSHEYYTSHVYYPKSEFTKEHLERNVVPKFDSCPHCRQGKCDIGKEKENAPFIEEKIEPLKSGSDFKFKYKPSHKLSYKNNPLKLQTMKRLKMPKMKLNLSAKALPYAGQGLAGLIRMPLSYYMNDLWSSIIFGGVGAVGNLLNEKYNIRETKKKMMLREMLTNWMYTFTDLSGSKSMAMKGQASDLWNGIRYGNYKSAFNVFRSPASSLGSLRSMFGGKFSFKNPFKGKFGSAGFKSSLASIPGITKEVSKADVQVYASKDDISDY